MAVESNINMYYEELIESLAERAYDSMKDGGYGDLNAKVKIVMQKNLSEKQIDLYKKLKELEK